MAAGCGGDSDSSALVEPTPKATVVLTDGAYLPSRVRIEAGSRVTFVNRDTEMLNTAETGGIEASLEYDREMLDRRDLFDTHVLYPGEAESVEFDTPGVYRFHSSIDSRMRGAVTVVAPSR